MLSHRGHLICTLLVVALLALGCSEPPPQRSSDLDRLHVTVSILPQSYFTERIGGDRVTVTVMVEPGQSPHTYEPKPEQLVALSRADAYFSIGVTFENAWLERFTAANPDMLLVDTAEGITRRTIEAHSHDDEDDHDHEADDDHDDDHAHDAYPDPHIWLSPRLAKAQARHITDALVSLDPENAQEYQSNLLAFEAEIDALHAEIEQSLASIVNRKFMVFHPSWGYFADEYGLEMIPIEVGGQEPSAAELAELIRIAKAESIRIVFAQPEFSTRTAEVLAQEIGGSVLLIDPLSADWADNLRTVAYTFAEVLGEDQ